MSACDDFGHAAELANGREEGARLAMAYLREAGESRGFTVTVAAIGMSEANSQWLRPRIEGMAFPLECAPCRTTVGLEFVRRGQNVMCWQPTMTHHPDVQKFMRDAGLIRSQDAILDPGRVLPAFPVRPEFQPPNNDLIADLFEFMVRARSTAMLRSFSIGPTQMWLGQTQMSLDYMESIGVPPSPAGLVNDFPQTWEAIYDFYTAASVPKIASFLSYLRGNVYPGDPSMVLNRDFGIQYLASRQTGSGIAAQYYDDFFGPNVRACSQWYSEMERGQFRPRFNTGTLSV